MMSGQTALAAAASDEFRCQPATRFPMGSSAELLYLTLKKEAQLLDPAEARLLGACGQFATLEAHAEQIAKRLPPGSADAANVLELLRALAAKGLMLSRSELMARIASLPRLEDPPRIAWLAIPTCDRPEMLRRCIKSFGENFRKYGRFPKLLVADDSKMPETRAATRAVVDEAGLTWGAGVEYVGLEEKRRLIDRLAAHGVPRDVLGFGILGPGGPAQGAGASRNVIVLHTLGDLVLSVDDDTVCQPCVAPGTAAGGLRLGAELDPSEYWFFPDRQSALAFAERADIDVLAGHERLLGRPVHSLAGAQCQNAGADMGSACSHMIQSLWEGHGRVLFTSNGAVGDSGMYSSRIFPLHRGNGTRSRLLASEEQYRAALESRELLRQPSTQFISHRSAFMSTFFGLDNRWLMPPFFPVGHCDDGIFAFVADRGIEGCYFGYLPWALAHDPSSSRAYSTRAATTVRISDVVMSCVATWSDPDRTSSSHYRIASLGERLKALACMPPDEFDEQIRAMLWQKAGQWLSRKESLLR